MAKVVGRIKLLNNAGDVDRDISVELGQYGCVDGTYGSLEVEAYKNPPLIRGKGNVWVGEGVRTTRLQEGQDLQIGISSDGNNLTYIGSIKVEK